jgi:hypothetical protein
MFTPCLFLFRNERDLLLDSERRLINGEASGLQALYQTLGKGVVGSFRRSTTFWCQSSMEISWGFSEGLLIGFLPDSAGALIALEDAAEIPLDVFIAAFRFKQWQVLPTAQYCAYRTPGVK